MKLHELITAVCVLAVQAFVGSVGDANAGERPNIVLIYGDDVGFADVGAYGAELIPTPNLDQLAHDGLMFTDGHCSAATCSPSRFSLLTGIHAFRHGVRVLPPNAPLTIPLDKLTLPKMLKQAGYTTAVIGKWHLGLGDGNVDWNKEVTPGPGEVGFDYSFLLPSTNDRVPCVYLENDKVVNLSTSDPLFVGKPGDARSTVYPNGKKNPKAMTYYASTHGHNDSVINGIGRIGVQFGGKSALWNDETMADEFVAQMKAYLSRQRADQPFFLYFSSQDIHVPRAPHPRFQGKTTLGKRGDAMVQLDWSVGEVLKTLEAEGLTDNTLVIFSSDNGPVYDDGYDDGTSVHTSTREVDNGHDASGPYRGGKYQIYEGGTRVPLIVKWPGKIKPGKSAALVNQIDFLASFAEMLDVPLDDDQAIDSRSVLSALLGKSPDGLDVMIEEARALAVRKGPWKYVRMPPPRKNPEKNPPKEELYNLDDDIGEEKNLITERPMIAKQMRELLTKMQQEQGVRHVLTQ